VWVTELSERYRRNAEKCLQLAQNFNDLEAKRSLLVMANAWLALAAQREKNVNVATRQSRRLKNRHQSTSRHPSGCNQQSPTTQCKANTSASCLAG
jgi:hypothetical protein